MELILYHYPFSTHSHKVRFCLEEKDLPWQSQVVDLKEQENLSEEFLRINPNGMVPVLAHDGRIICESNVIIEYIDEVFLNNKLMPQDSFIKAMVRINFVNEQFLTQSLRTLTFDWFLRTNRPPQERLDQLAMAYEKHPSPAQSQFFKKLKTGITTQELDQAKTLIIAMLNQLDKLLKNNHTQFMVGDDFTLADIVWAPFMHRLELLNIEFSNCKYLLAWWDQIKIRSAFIKASM